MPNFVALLRGINVGGRNLIPMAALRACFEQLGFDDVATYIQSGNIVFASAERRTPTLVVRIEELLSATFDYDASVVVRSRTQMRSIVDRAPRGFGAEPATYRYDVLFLKPPLRSNTALVGVPTREGVDQASSGPGVLFFSRLISRASQSQMSKIVSMPIYRQMTIRNWNTTMNVLQMLEA
jgi:uncharacterized protein (DUF1697 family)